MSPASWRAAPEVSDDRDSTGRPRPLLVSLHFIWAALRRRLAACLLCAILGVTAAGAYLLAFPPAHEATSTLLLTSDPQSDPTRSTTTNVSLFQTRTLATRTTDQLGLAMAPDDFLSSLTIEQAGSELLIVSLTAPTDTEAVRRLDVLTSVYLQFRAEQLSRQADVLVTGLRDRIQKLQADVVQASRQVEELTAANDPNPSDLNDAISLRASLLNRIATLEQAVEDATLRNSSVVGSSRVLDPPAPEPGRARRSVALALASGLFGGIALGCGTVVFIAITSNKLRRRSDIARSLGVEVAVSVGAVTPIRRPWRALPPFNAINRHRAGERLRLAQAITEELFVSNRSTRLAVAGIDNDAVVGFAVVEAASRLAEKGTAVTILDLTDGGGRGLATRRKFAGSAAAPKVIRPRVLPALAHHAADLRAIGEWEGIDNPTPELGEVTLILADLDPAIGADHLTAWTDRVVVVVTTGRSSVERIRTVGDQVRGAGLDLRFAALVNTDSDDDSLGRPNADGPGLVERYDGSENPGSAAAMEAR